MEMKVYEMQATHTPSIRPYSRDSKYIRRPIKMLCSADEEKKNVAFFCELRLLIA